MERKKYLFLIFFSLSFLLLCGQNNKAIYQAFISGNMTRWKKNIDSLNHIKQKTNKEKLDLINYQYGYVGYCIGQKKYSEAEDYIAKSEKYIKQLENKNYNLSMLFAYKAAFIGFEIGISPYKAPFIGSKSMTFAQKAVDYNPKNAFAYLQLANVAYYTPIIFGGSKKEAMHYYLKAAKIMEEDNEMHQNWNYLNLLAKIINAYAKEKKYGEAKKYCIKTLAIEPEFEWVKNDIYPKILKKCNYE